jgi:hypothetical protein
MIMKRYLLLAVTGLVLFASCGQQTDSSEKNEPTVSNHYDVLANIPLTQGYPSKESMKQIEDEIFFQRACQAYLWAIPALNMYGMKEGSEKDFGAGYHILPIWKERLNAKTKVTTPNSDVIYAMGYLDLKQDGPMVIEVPPGLQGILDDFFQRPIKSEGKINGREWAGDVGLPGPDQGKGGKYLILPPDYAGEIPAGYYTFRSGTYGVFVFWRGFFQDPKQLEAPVKVMEQTVIYPLDKKAEAKPMQFPNGSEGEHYMLYPKGIAAFEMLSRYIDNEYVSPADMEMRGILQSIGIEKGKPFNPTPEKRELLEKAGNAAYEMARVIAYDLPNMVPGTLWYKDRKWVNPFPGNADFTKKTYNTTDARISFFTFAYSASPGMALNMENVGAKYPVTFVDSEGNILSGSNSYKLHLPKDIPSALFWSVTLYDAVTASGLDNGQPFPSINTMDKPATNTDGSTDLYFGPTSPGEGKNWIKTIENEGFFCILRLYGPQKAFFDQTWIPGDIEKVK